MTTYHQYAKDSGYKLSSNTHYETLCPRCKHENRKFYIRIKDGVFKCFHCNWSGRWGGATVDNVGATSPQPSNPQVDLNQVVRKGISDLFNTRDGRHIGLNYLINKRKLKLNTIKYFQLGYHSESQSIILPTTARGSITALERRKCDPVDDRDRYFTYPGSKKNLFNTDVLALPSDSIVICEGIFDCMSAVQMFPKLPAIAVPGNSIFNPKWGELLRKYDKIYLMYDMSEQSEEPIRKWLQIVKPYKCYRPTIPYKDLNELLVESQDPTREYLTALSKAERLGKPLITSIKDHISNSVKMYTNPLQYVSTGFPVLDKITGGIRPGELNMLMGPTGVGKSTLASVIATNVANQGIKTMIGSFEISFDGNILPKVVSHLLKSNIEINKISGTQYRNVLKGLHDWGKLICLNREGVTPISEIVEAVEMSYKDGCRFVILDHLHYLIEPSKEERVKLVKAMKDLKALTKKFPDLMLMIVVHPSNPPKDMKTGLPLRLTMYNSKGASDIYQECDNFWVLNFDYEKQIVDLTVEKLRTDKVNVIPGTKLQVHFDKLRYQYNFI